MLDDGHNWMIVCLIYIPFKMEGYNTEIDGVHGKCTPATHANQSAEKFPRIVS